MGCDTVEFYKYLLPFFRNMLPPYRLEAALSSATWAKIYQTAWHHIPEDNNMQI
jgi:hypothetical protein